MRKLVWLAALAGAVCLLATTEASARGRRGCGGCGGCGSYCGSYGGCYGCYGGGCYGGCYGGGCYGGGYYGGCYGGGCYGGVPWMPPVTPPGGPPKDGGKPPVGGPPKEEAFFGNAPATLVVTLPADAKLKIDDYVTTSTSGTRVFTTPTLEAGKTFHYTLKAEIVRDGKPMLIEQNVAVRAGQSTPVTLSEKAAAVAAK